MSDAAVELRALLDRGMMAAAAALAGGTDEAQLRAAAENLARALGASSVAVVALLAPGEPPIVVADSDENRSEEAESALAASDSVARALASGESVVADEPPEAADGGAAGRWLVLPLGSAAPREGALVARFADGSPGPFVLEAGRMAAALLTVVLRTAKALEPFRDRTRKVTLVDIQAALRLRAIERYRAFIDSASDGILVLDTEGTVLYMNRAAEQVTGYARHGLAGKPLLQIVPEAHRAVLVENLERASRGDPLDNFDLDLITTSGDQMTVSVASIGVLSEHGAAIFAFRDVTLARHLELELRRTTEFLKRILNSAVDGVIAADMRGTIVLFNHGAERICGYRADDVIGTMSVKDLYPPGGAQEIMRLLKSSDHGRGGRLEPIRRELRAASGELIPVSISAALVLDDAGRAIATVGIFSDLRERLRMEERLATAQEKLAISEKQAVAIELAGAAAHELNQPLTSVMGYAQMLIRKLEPQSPHLSAVETIFAEAERMAGIVRQIGSLTRYETKTYVGGAQIIDLDRSAGEPPSGKR